MLVAEDGHHALGALLRQRQIVHEEPDEDERQRRRNRPEVADILHIHHAIRPRHALAEERGEIPAQEDRRRQIDERYAEVADARIDAERESLVRLGEEEADIRHRSGEVCARDADERHEKHERLIRRCGILQSATQAEERQQKKRRRDESGVPAANQSRQIRVKQASRRADETGQRREREDLIVREVEADKLELRRDRRPERPRNEAQDERPSRGVEVLRRDALAILLPKARVLGIPTCKDLLARWIGTEILPCHFISH